MHYLHALMLGIIFTFSWPAVAAPVDINTADAATLAAAIDGVGEKRAATIVRYREQYGPFDSIDELANVQGIGAATVERNRRNLMVTTPAGSRSVSE